ncbi:MAG: radical SAM protein, partial [Candidatus Aenigmarchaeota archaeon]|nr:radical SAM protein [Candidatus Aenigmarchaeota archaeon]
ELGDIIRFGMKNIGTVRAVNFQPVSLVGRMPDKLRRRQRITIPGAIKRIEEQTDGQIGREHWFPVPCAKQITDFIEAVKQEPKYRLSIHFACGMATYAFKDGEKMVALPEFFDIEGFFEYLAELTKEINNSKMRKVRVPWTLAKLAWNIRKYVDNDKKPKELKFVRMLTGAVQGGNYHGLADLHKNSLFIGMMHFQDPHNWDIDRIHKCDIHYASPDGRVLPFCTFNVIPALYRDKIQRKFSIPSEEWEKKTGKKIAGFKYHRKLTPEQMKEIKTVYDTCRKHMTKITPEADWGDEDAETIASQGAARTNEPVIAGAAKFGAAKYIDNSQDAPKVNLMGGCGSCSTTPMTENGIISYGPSESDSHEHGNGEGCCSSPAPNENAHKNGNGKKINIIQDDDHSEEGHGGCGSGGCGCGRSESGGGCC